jgi:hypothetical protein
MDCTTKAMPVQSGQRKSERKESADKGILDEYGPPLGR